MSPSLFVVLALLQAPPSPSPSPAAGPVGSAHPEPAGLQVIWQRSFEAAVAEAKKIPNGRILIEFVDEDCGPCQRMEALIVPSTSFWVFTRDKVPVRLVRSSPEGKRLSERLTIPEVPAWIVVTPDLVVSGAQIGSTTQRGWIDAFVQAEKGWAAYRKMLEAEAKDPGDPSLVFEVAKETFKRGGDSLAEPRFVRLVKDARAAPDIREESLACLASIELDAGRLDEAARHLDRLLATAKDQTLKERAELRLADVEIARGRKDRAIRRLRDFQKAHPFSRLSAEADMLLQKLESPKAEPTPRSNQR